MAKNKKNKKHETRQPGKATRPSNAFFELHQKLMAEDEPSRDPQFFNYMKTLMDLRNRRKNDSLLYDCFMDAKDSIFQYFMEHEFWVIYMKHNPMPYLFLHPSLYDGKFNGECAASIIFDESLVPEFNDRMPDVQRPVHFVPENDEAKAINRIQNLFNYIYACGMNVLLINTPCVEYLDHMKPQFSFYMADLVDEELVEQMNRSFIISRCVNLRAQQRTLMEPEAPNKCRIDPMLSTYLSMLQDDEQDVFVLADEDDVPKPVETDNGDYQYLVFSSPVEADLYQEMTSADLHFVKLEIVDAFMLTKNFDIMINPDSGKVMLPKGFNEILF